MTACSDWIASKTPKLDILAVSLASISWRLYSCEYMMLADQDHKWMASKLLLQQGVLAEWTQHTLRWMSTVPLFAINALFGFNPALYYVWPIILSTLAVVFVYLIGAKIYGRCFGLAFAMAAVLFPPMVSAGSQLEPTANMLPFVLGAVYCVMLWDESARIGWLACSGLLVFMGYGAKINAMIFAVPIAAYVIWARWRRDRRMSSLLAGMKNALTFSATLLGCMAAEGTVLYWLSGFPYGRILLELKGSASDAVRMQGYGDSGFEYSDPLALILSARELLGFDIFQKLSLLGGLVTSVFALLYRVRSLYLFAFCFLFDFAVTTFMVRSLTPIILAQPHYPRYYIVECVLGAMITGLFLYGMFSSHFKTSALRRSAFAAVLLLCFASVSGRQDYWRLSKDIHAFLSRPNGIRLTLDNEKLIQDALRDGMDIAIEIDEACGEDLTLKNRDNFSFNGVARVHSFWSYYGSLERKPDFAGIARNRMCSRTAPGKLWVFPYGVGENGDHPVLVGRHGGVRYEWSVFREQNFVDTPGNS